MPVVSGTYDFQSLANDDLILECFERIGMSGEQLVPMHLQSARRSLNFLLLDWISKNINLWTINKLYLPLNTGQSTYALETSITDVLQVNLRTFTRQLNGTAYSNTGYSDDGLGGGDAEDAFDNNYLTSCTQTTATGNISYGFTTPQIITFIGIRANQDITYTLVVEYYASDTNNWNILNVDNLAPTSSYTYSAGVTRWLDVITPVSSDYYRVREMGEETLDLQEIYFVNNTTDLQISPVSRNTYLSFSQKFLQTRPSTYYFEKALTPNLIIWPTPTSDYLVLQYSFIRTMYDAGEFFNTVSVPAKMYPALAAGLTWLLARKYNPEIVDMMKAEYDEAFAFATAKDSENVDLSMNYDIGNYYEN